MDLKGKKIARMTKDRKVLFSFAMAFLLSVLSYFTNNWQLFTGENLNVYTQMEFVRNLFDVDDDYSGAFFVNTSMDKQLIEIQDEYAMPVGNTEITDRRKLLEFLKLLEGTDYGYVVIDIRFADELKCKDSIGQEIDRQLINQIMSMDRCVVATHRDVRLFGGLESKAALADYKSTVTASNFVRYEYFDSIPSIPLHVYNETRKYQGLDTIDYSKAATILGVYKEGNRLCQNSVFLEFSCKGFPRTKQILSEYGNFQFIGKHNYWNLGFDFVDHLDNGIPRKEVVGMLESVMKESGNGKKPVVFIGNVQEDLHDTYAGLQPGVIILYKALSALQEGRHIVNPFHVILLFFLYFFMCLFILKDITVWKLVPDRIAQKQPFSFLLFILQLATLSTVLFVIDVIDIKCFGITTNFVFTVLVFNLLKLYVQFEKFIRNETGH